MTQEELAAASNLTSRSIRDLETARSLPRFGALLAICDALQLEIVIADRHDEPRTPSSDPDGAPIDLDELLGGGHGGD